MKLFIMEMVVQIAGGPLVSALMPISNWYPLGISSVLLVVAGIMAFMLPESHPQYRSAVFGPPIPECSQDCSPDPDDDVKPAESNLRMIRKEIFRACAITGSLLKNSGIWLCLSVFLLASCGAHAWAFLVQYVSQKFRWEFSTVGPSPFLSIPSCIWEVLNGESIKIEGS